MKWYKHFSKMRLDIKIKRLLDKYGIVGYGVYNYILECIAFRLDPENPVPEIEENCNDLAKEMKIDTIQLEEIIKFCVNENLFEINQENNRIMCLKLLNHLDNTLSSNPEIKKILNNFKELKETSRDLKQIRLDKIRLDKNNISDSVESPLPQKKIKKTKEIKTYFEDNAKMNEIIQSYCSIYEEQTDQKLKITQKEIGCFKNLINIFHNKEKLSVEVLYDIFHAAERNSFFYDSQLKIWRILPSPSIILSQINQLRGI